MVMPRPVPPRPCICPRPTCVNASLPLSLAWSSALRPTPVSLTSSTHVASGAGGERLAAASGAAVASSVSTPSWLPCSRHALTVTSPPASVNLSALLMPLLRHCCRRRTSPTRPSAPWAPPGDAMSSVRSLTSFESAIPLKVCVAASRRALTGKGLRTSTSRPESMRSKSSMSETMCCMSSEHVLSDRTHSAPSASLSSVPVPVCTSPSKLAALLTDSKGLRRSCITMRMSRLRAALAASAVLSWSSFSASLRARRYRSATAIRTERKKW
mmetsp:Transcript_24070/g.62012  ORF Transcript_24070/g.62012 Transcript_24070/m.62012 type:complete len:270 (-) Transcript_24070:636-1445(-)